MLVFNVAYYALDITSLYIDTLDHSVLMIAQSISFGIVGVLMGVAMLRLQKALGTIATVTGIFEIVAYACFVIVIFAAGGAILLIPTIIFEIIILYKIAQLVREKMEVSN